MLQQEGPPVDVVIATGRQESVRRFIELTALELGWTPTTILELPRVEGPLAISGEHLSNAALFDLLEA